MKLDRSAQIFAAAKEIIPGGVNSPVRAYRSVGGTPVHMARGEGAHVWDVDGNRYIDLVMSYGPLILGHCDPRVVEAVRSTAGTGTCFGTPSQGELDIAREIVARVPGCEMVRLVNSGTEATMSALRLARAFTGREVVVKFDGCYHGHGDSFLVKAGSGALTNGAPDSPGVPAKVAGLTLVARYNDLEHVRALLDAHGAQVACMIVEPVVGNIGLVRPDPGFLAGLRELCTRHGANGIQGLLRRNATPVRGMSARRMAFLTVRWSEGFRRSRTKGGSDRDIVARVRCGDGIFLRGINPASARIVVSSTRCGDGFTKVPCRRGGDGAGSSRGEFGGARSALVGP